MLNTIFHPAAKAMGKPPLVIVHGLYGSARNWNAIAHRLADSRDVIAVDQRNHGDSPRFATQSYPEMAEDIAAVIGTLSDRYAGPVDILGHSMGGKTVMELALTHGALLRRLIVADIAPVAYNHDQSQYARAMQALDLTGLSSRSATDARLTALIEDPSLRAFFLQSLDLRAEGGPKWKLNLPVLEAEMSKITGWSGTKGRFDGPALFLTGALSHYVRPEHRAEILALFPHARFAKLPGAGHWLHAEKPREFTETVRIFLEA